MENYADELVKLSLSEAILSASINESLSRILTKHVFIDDLITKMLENAVKEAIDKIVKNGPEII